MCQCPRRAILISTYPLTTTRKQQKSGVNALGGLFSFLPIILDNIASGASKSGVNALGGLFSFLRIRQLLLNQFTTKKGVNALGGLFSFLQLGKEK